MRDAIALRRPSANVHARRLPRVRVLAKRGESLRLAKDRQIGDAERGEFSRDPRFPDLRFALRLEAPARISRSSVQSRRNSTRKRLPPFAVGRVVIQALATVEGGRVIGTIGLLARSVESGGRSLERLPPGAPAERSLIVSSASPAAWRHAIAVVRGRVHEREIVADADERSSSSRGTARPDRRGKRPR